MEDETKPVDENVQIQTEQCNDGLHEDEEESSTPMKRGIYGDESDVVIEARGKSRDEEDGERRGIKHLGGVKTSEEPKKPEQSMFSEVVQTVVMAFVIFLFVKGLIAEARYIPSSSMEPTLNINDRILVEKLSNRFLGRTIERGDVLVFYPPEIETGAPDNPWLQSVGGLPFFEGPPVFVKRVVGLPGDVINIQKGVGVFINGQPLRESYIMEPPQYDLNRLGDIGGMASTRQIIQPYGENEAPIVVPAGHYFMMGDNRNHSADSHVWGFLDKHRIVGRSCLVFWQDKWLKGLTGQ